MDLFGAAEDAARDAAIMQADRHADPAWKAAALDAVKAVAAARPTFVSDDVWATGLPKPREPRALGAIIQRAHLLGYCVPTGQFRGSLQEGRHRGPVRVWQSRIYPGAQSELTVTQRLAAALERIDELEQLLREAT